MRGRLASGFEYGLCDLCVLCGLPSLGRLPGWGHVGVVAGLEDQRCDNHQKHPPDEAAGRLVLGRPFTRSTETSLRRPFHVRRIGVQAAFSFRLRSFGEDTAPYPRRFTKNRALEP